MTNQVATSLYEQFADKFKDFEAGIHSSDKESLSLLRKSAFERFRMFGFPSIKHEDWKYTNIVPYLKENFEIEKDSNNNKELIAALVKTASIPSLDCYKVVLVNGKISGTLPVFPGGMNVKLQPFSRAKNEESFYQYFGKTTDVNKSSFAALNTAMFTNGLFLEAGSCTSVDKPIHIIHIYTSENNIFLQTRNLVVAHPGSHVQVIESTINTEEDSAIFVNSLSEVILEENALVDHFYIQAGKKGRRFIQHTQVSQQRQSVYNNYTFSLPEADLVRNNLNIALEGKHAESNLFGLYLASDHQLIDNHTLVDHLVAECNSNEHYKGVLLGNAKAVFNGKIFVRKDAQKTNAFQQNNNLLLSEKAVIDSKPQLEIYADDVKCSHGATVGSLNTDALFYLQSRGIGETTARNLLVNAFAFDITNKIKNLPLKAHIEKLIRNYMSQLYD